MRRRANRLLTLLPLLLLWAAPVLAGEGDEAGEAAEGGVHWATVGWKGFNFAVLILVLWKFLAAPIKGYFVKRREDIKAQLAAAEAARAEAVGKLRDIEHKLSTAESEAAALMKKAEEESVIERERLLAAAREESERMRALAQDEIRRATDAARAELRAYAAELATTRAADIVAGQIQDGDRARLFAEYLASLEKGMPSWIRRSLARKYARALVQSAAKRNVLSKVIEQVSAPARLAAADPELEQFLESLAYPESAKRNVIDTILGRLYPADGGGIDPITRNFFEALVSHHRLADYLAIVAALEESVDESEGVLKAVVTTATALSPEDQKVLMGALARATMHPVRLELAVNATLLGGVVTQIGSTIYDGSVRTRLQKMKQQLSEGA